MYSKDTVTNFEVYHSFIYVLSEQVKLQLSLTTRRNVPNYFTLFYLCFSDTYSVYNDDLDLNIEL